MKNGKIKAYKGFNTDLTCRDFQYEVGKEYEQKGEIEACNKGFHACETPMDVFEHYLIEKDGHIARFCEVEQSGMIDREDDKVASSKISIKAEVKFADFVKLAVDFVLEKCKVGKGNSEDFAQLASSGNFAKFASSGSYAQLASSGNFAQLASSGSYAQLASSGDSAKLASSGNSAVVMAAGYNSQAKAKKGSWITLAEWDRLDGNWTPVCVKTEQVDGERIKEDTWYKLINGQFTEI